jgi:hypothetical protein
VRIDAGEPEILQRRGAQRLHQARRGARRIHGSGAHVIEEPLNLLISHIAYNPVLC